VSDERLQATLGGYAKFLRQRDLALPNQQPYLVRWVRASLVFAREHGGYTFEQTLDMCLPEIGFGPAGPDAHALREHHRRAADLITKPAS